MLALLAAAGSRSSAADAIASLRAANDRDLETSAGGELLVVRGTGRRQGRPATIVWRIATQSRGEIFGLVPATLVQLIAGGGCVRSGVGLLCEQVPAALFWAELSTAGVRVEERLEA
jgi:hypothetical protein